MVGDLSLVCSLLKQLGDFVGVANECDLVQNRGNMDMELCLRGVHDFRRQLGILGIIFALVSFSGPLDFEIMFG